MKFYNLGHKTFETDFSYPPRSQERCSTNVTVRSQRRSVDPSKATSVMLQNIILSLSVFVSQWIELLMWMYVHCVWSEIRFKNATQGFPLGDNLFLGAIFIIQLPKGKARSRLLAYICLLDLNIPWTYVRSYGLSYILKCLGCKLSDGRWTQMFVSSGFIA